MAAPEQEESTSTPPDQPYDASLRPHHGRLQRGPGASGYRVTTFADVLRRHGTTMGGIALLGMMAPGAVALLQNTTARFMQHPWVYLFATAGLLVFFALWSRRRPQPIARQCRWIFYLLFISIAEEVAFRLVVPMLLTPPMGILQAHIISNLIFAGLHYFTLRWKLRNCIGTFIGGMGLSHLMGQGDLVLVVLVHWLGTFLNTPFAPPERRAV